MNLTLLTQQNREAFFDLMPRALYELLSDPDTVAVGASDEADEAAGVIVSVADGEWLEILWIYVHETARDKGVARQLMEYLLLTLSTLDGVRGMTARFPEELYLSPVHNLFKRLHFDVSKEQVSTYQITAGDVGGNPFFADKQPAKAALALGDIPPYTLSAFEKKLMLSDMGIPLEMPVDWRTYDKACSIGYIKEQALRGILLFSPDGDGGLELSLAYADPGESAALSLMLRAAGKKITETRAPDTRISLAALSAISAQILEKLFPGEAKTPAYRATYTFYRNGRA